MIKRRPRSFDYTGTDMQTLHSIQKALDLIEARLAQSISIEELARCAGMSLWHFQRTFSAIVGEPAGRYLRRRRIASAAQRLLDHEGTLLDLALDYQFESHEAFTRAFKAELDATPSEWREGRGGPRYPRRREFLTQRKSHQPSQTMNLLPDFVTLDPAAFIGFEGRFIPDICDEGNNMQVIPKLWDAFFERRSEVPANEPNASYGLCEDLEAHGIARERPDEALYLASARVDPEVAVPEGMRRWTSPGGLFARFEHRGPTDKIGETMAFIYGKWFPSSDFEGATGPDFVRIDQRFKPDSDRSLLEILVPVAKR